MASVSVRPRARWGALIVVLCLCGLMVALGAQPAAAAPSCTTDCYVDAALGNDANSGTAPGAGNALQTIQAAINQVNAGGTVHVAAGTYPESPTINKSLTLIGDDGRDVTFIELQTGTNYTHSLLISGADVTVEGFTIVGIDAACPTLAASNIYLNTAPDNVVIKNNRIQVGAIGGCSNGDDGFGLVTQFSGNPDVASLTVEGNIFEPLNAAGRRAFYINPSVVDFTFRDNEITGQFDALSVSEAQNNLIEDNTITGTGTSAGIALWGYLDPGLWGTGTIQGNTISGTVNAISIFDAENVTVTKNVLDGNGRGVRVLDSAFVTFDLSTIHINRNAITNNTTLGVLNSVGDFDSDGNYIGDTDVYDVDSECNWWGDASGPGPVGPGSGDSVSTDVDFGPWLYSDDLDGNCYVGGTIEIVKVAEGGELVDFTFDVSWSDDHVVLKGGESYVTDPPLPAGPGYSISEINLPPGWTPQSATCEGPDNITGDPANLTVYDDASWVCTFTNVYSPPSTCPATGSGSTWTDILGIGMGNVKKHKTVAKLAIPNWGDVTSLYGQLVAKDWGNANFVRFMYPGPGNYEQVNAITSPPAHVAGNFWYGTYLDPAPNIRGRWFLQPSGVKFHIPRAFVLYPTYTDPVNTYVNVWDTFDATESEVDWNVSAGWVPYHEIVVPIAANQAPTTFHVELALTDNDKDAREVWITVTAGGVTQTVTPNNPNKGDLLNILEFDLPNVPEGTDEIVIDVYSPSMALDGVIGDSAMVVGMAAHYQCLTTD